MGNCTGSNNLSNVVEKKFINSNLIDSKYKIVLGTYLESNKGSKNLNSQDIQVNQGIWIGKFSDKIYKLKFGIFHQHENKSVELYFEDNIKLVLMKNINTDEIEFTLTYGDIEIIETIGTINISDEIKYNNKCIVIKKSISKNTIGNFKYIGNNSEHIDLIVNLKKNN